MKPLLQTVLTVVLLIEIVMFTGFYCFGPQGMKALACAYEQNCILEQRVANSRAEIALLEEHIRDFERYDFYKEKIARESLQMAYPTDVVYYLS